MLDEDSGSAAPAQTTSGSTDAPKRRRAGSRPAGPPGPTAFSAAEPAVTPTKKQSSRKKTAAKKTTPAKKSAAEEKSSGADEKAASSDEQKSGADEKAASSDEKKSGAAPKKKASAAKKKASADEKLDSERSDSERSERPTSTADATTVASPFATPLFQAPDPVRTAGSKTAVKTSSRDDAQDQRDDGPDDSEDDGGSEDGSGGRRRRRRGGRRRRRSDDDSIEHDESSEESNPDDSRATNEDDQKPGNKGGGKAGNKGGDGKSGNKADGKAGNKGGDSKAGSKADDKADDKGDGKPDDTSDDSEETGGTSRRRRRRRRRGDDPTAANDDPANTVTKVRDRRSAEDEITSVSGSTRLEAKKQRRREGREAGRRRVPIVTEAEFLARRESVKREMVIRQRSNLSQIAVLEDDVLVEHYVAAAEQSSMIGNVYVGRVQNVLPSMEAAFIDIGKGRNGVLYAGEVDWKALGNGKPRKIEEVLKSGQTVLVQVTKDPVGHKGARLTSQISLAGRFLVYVPGGQTNGISRKLPDTERNRLKGLLKEILPEEAGVIIRTAAEGATEDQLNRDVSALTARWDDIEAKSAKQNAPQLLYAEPDLMIKVVRDLFNEDFAKLTVEGDDAWDMVEAYVQHVASDLADRLERRKPDVGLDVFESYRIDEQIAKATDRKVWLPSGGSLIIDRTEAMTVVDVNTGKFTGSGGNLEETVTKNNLEAAEEIVRQLRLRDIGGIIVIDFIDMVLENNRDLVLRRLVECLGRDRTRHQVAEVTSLGLVQMTRKRIGTGLVEAFSETCEHCNGRGLVVHSEPIEPRKREESPRGRRRGKGSTNDDKSGGDKSGGDKSGGDKSGGDKPGDGAGTPAGKAPGEGGAQEPPSSGTGSKPSGRRRATRKSKPESKPDELGPDQSKNGVSESDEPRAEKSTSAERDGDERTDNGATLTSGEVAP